MTPATSTLKGPGVGYDADSGNYLMTAPTTTTPVPLVGPTNSGIGGGLTGISPNGMNGPYGPGSVVFSMSMGQDTAYTLASMDGAGPGADLGTGSGGDAGGVFEDMGGKMTGTQVVAWNQLEQNTAVGEDLNNGQMTQALGVLNQEMSYLETQLPTYTPGASLSLQSGLVKLAAAGISCSPAVGAAGVVLGAMADNYSGGGYLGPTLKASSIPMLAAGMLVPIIICVNAIDGVIGDNNARYAVNVLGTSAINAAHHLISGYGDMGMQIVKAGMSPSMASDYDLSDAKSSDLGSAANLKLEALGLSTSLAGANTGGHHANFVTGVFS